MSPRKKSSSQNNPCLPSFKQSPSSTQPSHSIGHDETWMHAETHGRSLNVQVIDSSLTQVVYPRTACVKKMWNVKSHGALKEHKNSHATLLGGVQPFVSNSHWGNKLLERFHSSKAADVDAVTAISYSPPLPPASLPSD